MVVLLGSITAVITRPGLYQNVCFIDRLRKSIFWHTKRAKCWHEKYYFIHRPIAM